MESALRTTVSIATLTCALGALVLVTPAYAGKPVGSDRGAETEQTGGADETGIHSAVRIEYTGSVTPNGGSGNVTSADPNWMPSPCRYAPYLGAEDFKKEMSTKNKDAASAPGMTGTPGAAIGQTKAHYEDGFGWEDRPGYEDYDVAKDGEGMFWAGVENLNEPDILKRSSCTELPFWVDNGEAPPPRYERAITPEMLAALSYQHMELAGTEVTLAPAETTKVDLPTWAWLDKTDFHEVRATASINVPGFALTATTTAKPVSLKLEPGTPDAETYLASGECTFDDDGSIGDPYTKGKADQTPPCGIRYLRSSEDGTFENAQAVTIQEIKAVNR
ncbi:hypothetical protein [Streptomyces coelicoflavus]|uniref:hypothetical protein n=1 Tax=Streptomyces coelicoflavus TaxID=285562 RepID=UPI003F4A0354